MADAEIESLRAQVAALTAERDRLALDIDDWRERTTALAVELAALKSELARAKVCENCREALGPLCRECSP